MKTYTNKEEKKKLEKNPAMETNTEDILFLSNSSSKQKPKKLLIEAIIFSSLFPPLLLSEAIIFNKNGKRKINLRKIQRSNLEDIFLNSFTKEKQPNLTKIKSKLISN